MSQITAFGTYVPEKVIDNHYFESFMDTNDEWIISRTGIKTRRFSKDGEYTSDLAVKAVENLVEQSGTDISDVDYIIVCTTSPDQPMPNAASRVQYKLGIKNAGCNDVYAACAGFIYGLQIAHGFVNSGVYKKVLVIGAETLSKITDFEDRTSCILFGDAAGAALIEPSEEEHFIAFNSGTNGDLGHDLYLSHKKNSINGVGINPHGKIVQNGRSVFKWAVGNIPIKIRELIAKAGLTLDDIDYIVPHSANLRIIEAIAKDLNYPMDRVPESVTEFGNTSSASIPLAIAKSERNGGIKKGDKLLLIGFGGGLTFAGTIVIW
ncbi:MAG: ketoacyl-ACP synthase III [Ekhidna sp.]|uniref:ketoacyl-ACP synthase III n=1 Tax=Ekhidna sp. TaxID=2608089 RepID=UPI0032EDE07F